jgi:hypothetical protein
LNAAGFDTFLDTKELPPGQEFNARIKAAVDDSDVFIFFVSQDSVKPGSYSLTELAFAEAKWRNPAGYVLPVMATEFDPGNLPTYLRPINALIVRGNLEAEVVGWIQDRATGEGGGGFGLTIEERLKKWARLSQPPIRKARRRIPGSSIGRIIGGVVFIIFGRVFMDTIIEGRKFKQEHFPGSLAPLDQIFSFVPHVLFFIGLALIITAVFRAIQGLRGGEPVAAAVLDRESRKNNITVHLQTVDGRRLKLAPVTRAARNVYSGDLGWAYVSGGLLIDFIAVSSQSVSDSQNRECS